MGVLDQRAHDKLNTTQWKPLRDFFVQVAEVILGISPDAQGVSAGNYVKFTTGPHPTSPVYAVVWPKMSLPKRVIVGLALPDDFEAEPLGPPPERLLYRGITKFLVIYEEETMPKGLSEWVKRAYEEVLSPDGLQ
mgnify:CR=1 FL=1